ncbi:MAG: hypothetical protein ACP5NP_07915 [Acetobacteraceae bacterium]
MTFANEDKLAIHTVAAAAYRIVRDLLDKRGRSDLEDLVAAGVYVTARALAAGELPKTERDDLTRDAPWLHDKLMAISEEIKRGGAVTPDEIQVPLDRRAEWSRLSATANFLKHADRDTKSHLSLDEVNNDETLIRACAAYAMAVGQTPDDLRQTPEMSAFHIWWISLHDPAQLAREYGDKLADQMQQLSPSKRRRACLRLIRLFTRWRSEAAGGSSIRT